jgi:hypothetical protein
MKGAIASVEIYAHRNTAPSQGSPEGVEVRRLTLVLGVPERAEDGAEWRCRVALADLERPQDLIAPDSVTALARAIGRGRGWLAGLEREGWTLYRDRSGTLPMVLE